MMNTLRLTLLGLLLGTQGVEGWDHVNPAELNRVISETETPVLVACKSRMPLHIVLLAPQLTQYFLTN